MSSEQELSEVLREFAATMVTDFPIQGILDGLVERIVEILPVTGAGVTLIAPGVDPRYVAASNAAALQYEKLQTELGEGPCVAAYHTGEAVEVPDLGADKRFPSFARPALAAGLAAVFTFPLRQGRRRLGALDLYRDEPGALSAGSMTTAQTLADVVAAYLVNAQARADLQDSSDRSHHAALHDGLTGLPNRVLLLEHLDHAFRRARRSGRTPAVLFVDLDRFKAINDAYGHRIGDELLVAVADRLLGLLRTGDTLGRLSGDEFVILCEDLAFPSDVERVVSRVLAALATPFVLSGITVGITASVGIAVADRADVAPEQILHDADLAMYRAKRLKSDGRQVFDLREDAIGQPSGLEVDLDGIVARAELHLDYQPIVDTVDGQMLGAEALLRWIHPLRGLIPPSVLVPLAEHSGLIDQIGQWVMERAWADRDRWRPHIDNHIKDLAVSVNVSAQQLMSAGFADRVATVLDAATTDPHLLTLEVTESVLVRDADRALMVLHDVKDMGVLVALDDFGTGYSSLSYLKQFPVDVVKIDKAFIADLGRDPPSQAIVAAVIGLAHGLGMTVVAEGVETAEQHHVLDRLGCDRCQGYYFAHPMPAASVETLVELQSNGRRPMASRCALPRCAGLLSCREVACGGR